MKLDIIGGCYYEYCRDPHWEELYGSGLRAAHVLCEREHNIKLHTFADLATKRILEFSARSLGIDVEVETILESGSFFYEHPFANPIISAPVGVKNYHPIVVDNALVFGTLEKSRVVKARRVVYDPQSPMCPQSFYANGSEAKELIWISNEKELFSFTNTSIFQEAVDRLFKIERLDAAIIKRGAAGAELFIGGRHATFIPAYQTRRVFPIGSGDVFSSVFAYEWLINNAPYSDAARHASLATARYVTSAVLPVSNDNEDPPVEFHQDWTGKKKVYLAGPFFTMGQRWIIEQIKDGLEKIGFDVFSPFHDVGLGGIEVAKADIIGLKNADTVVAILDGFDAGTLYEIGYARALGIPVITFYEGNEWQPLTMILGSDCIVESDFSTLIYKALWLTK